jgi:hypothetical protein
MGIRGARRPISAAAALILVAALAGTAWAAEVSRTEYRGAAEPICKADTQANERILTGVRQEVRQGKLGRAAAKFSAAAKALKKTIRQLEALPRPTADEARLERWFVTLKTEVGYFQAVSRKLKAGQRAAAESFVTKLTVTATKANNQVLRFEFTYCRLEPSRFT